MGKTTGFMEYKRVDESYDAVDKRLKHYKEFTIPVKEKELQNQGARCMDCGIPFCHSGCPLGNLIPDFNDNVYRGNWEKAANTSSTAEGSSAVTSVNGQRQRLVRCERPV